MKKRSDKPEDLDRLREKIIGLGEHSIRKSYYPKLQEQIHELERAEERFRQLSRRYELILESAGEGIFGLDRQGNYTFMNKAAAAMLGYKAEELIGKHSHTCIHYLRANGSCYPEEQCRTYAAFRDGIVRHVDDECFCRKDGTTFQVEYTSTPIFEGGKITGAVVTFSDITERKRAEETLKLTQFSVDHASVSAFLIGKNAKILYVNEQACRSLGYTRNELLEMSIPDLDPNVVSSEWNEVWERSKKEGGMQVETFHRRKDGSMMLVNISANYISFAGVEYCWAFGVDISDRKKAEQELARLNRQNELILESAGDGILGINIRGDHTLVNSAAARILGYEPGELMGKHSHKIWHHTRAEGTPYPEQECRIYKTMRDGMSQQVNDEVFWRKDGSAIAVEYTTTPIYEETAIVGTVVTFRDITEQKRAEEALRLSESRFRNLFKQSSLGMQILSPDGWTLEVNRAWEELWGLKLDMLKGYNVLHDKQLIAKGSMPYIQKGFAGEATEIPVVLYDPSQIDHAGRARWVKAFIYPVKAKGGNIHQVVLMHVDVTEMVKTEEALRESEERLALAQSTARVGVFDWDLISGNVFWTEQLEELFGLPPGGFERNYEGWAKHIHPDDLRDTEARFRQWLRERTRQAEFEYRFIRIDGQVRWMAASAQFSYLADGTPARMIGTNVDITERKRAEEALRGSEQFLRNVLDNLISFVAVLTPAGVLLEVNRSSLNSGGLSAEDVLGKPFEETYWVSWSPEVQARVREAIRKGAGGELSRFDMQVRVAGGALMPVDFMLAPIYDEYGRITHLILSAVDITDRKRMEDEIRHMAHHDTLTGLPNRRLFNDIAALELAQAERNNKKFAVLFLDLDRFKEINDTLGHEVGDNLLKEVAFRLKSLLRKSDSIGRIGGDEFNIILADIHAADDVSDIARKLVGSFTKPFMIAGHELHITTSVGISIYPDDSNEIDTLLRYSDMAMYDAKESGRNTYRFYNPSINIRSIERMRLENMLQRSLELGEMVMYYQPQVSITDRKIVSAEALIRWRHPERGLLLPKDFIPAAEETGFITRIDDWVVKAVCKQLSSWLKAGLPRVCVTVNLSARQFQNPDLVNKIESILKETGVPPDCLDIEIPESMAMSNVERNAERMRELTMMGIHISIDDFGTGYSSLNYLKRLPIGKLKIDKSFIQDIATDANDRAIINAVTSMAHNMEMKVIAEGVETENQLSFLQESHCDEAQGFLFGKPLPAEEFRELIAQSA